MQILVRHTTDHRRREVIRIAEGDELPKFIRAHTETLRGALGREGHAACRCGVGHLPDPVDRLCLVHDHLGHLSGTHGSQVPERHLVTGHAQLAAAIELQIVQPAHRSDRIELDEGQCHRHIIARGAEGVHTLCSTGHGGRIVLRDTGHRERGVQAAARGDREAAGIAQSVGPACDVHHQRRITAGVQERGLEVVVIGGGQIEGLAQPVPARLQEVHQLTVDEMPITKGGDGEGGIIRAQFGIRNARWRIHIDADEVGCGVGIDIAGVHEPVVLHLPSVRSGPVEQQVVTRAEHAIATVHHLNGIEQKVRGPFHIVHEGQQAEMVAVDVDPVGAQRTDIRPHVAQGLVGDLIDAILGDGEAEPIAGRQFGVLRVGPLSPTTGLRAALHQFDAEGQQFVQRIAPIGIDADQTLRPFAVEGHTGMHLRFRACLLHGGPCCTFRGGQWHVNRIPHIGGDACDAGGHFGLFVVVWQSSTVLIEESTIERKH